jgi:2-polyprenyl-6-methoxyphenol hydroxylase-like FAD-dependent oxidoreductase
VLERRGSTQSNLTKAFAVHARTMELFDARGLIDALLAHGASTTRIAPLGNVTLDLGMLDSRYAWLQIVPQSGTEEVLLERARALGVPIVEDAELVDVRQNGDTVELDVTDGTTTRTERARFVVGCDGSRSAVRSALGVDFVGAQYETHILLADVQLDDPPEGLFGANNGEGTVLFVPFGDEWYRAIAWDRSREEVPLDVEVTGADMRDAFRRIAGTDYGMSEPRWTSRFLSERRQARTYRVGNVFLAGDAAHVHSPLGGQGMNTGLQDAVNLGWKLAAAVQGWAPPWLLDSYQGERHPVGARVLRMTDMFNKLVLGRTAVGRALRTFAISTMLRVPRSRRELAERLTGLGIAYEPRDSPAHPSAGHRVPDRPVAEGRLYEHLRDAKFLLLDSTGLLPDDVVAPWSGRARLVRMAPADGIAPVVLVRPDAYVAWATEESDPVDAVRSTLAEWCGQPATVVR